MEKFCAVAMVAHLEARHIIQGVLLSENARKTGTVYRVTNIKMLASSADFYYNMGILRKAVFL